MIARITLATPKSMQNNNERSVLTSMTIDFTPKDEHIINLQINYLTWLSDGIVTGKHVTIIRSKNFNETIFKLIKPLLWCFSICTRILPTSTLSFLILAWQNLVFVLYKFLLLASHQDSSLYMHLMNFQILYCNKSYQQLDSRYTIYKGISIKVIHFYPLATILVLNFLLDVESDAMGEEKKMV